MKATKLLALALCVAAIATSCRKNDETPKVEGKQIAVSAQMYNFTKATDTAFEEGDAIGLHILTNTTWLDNAKYTYTGGKLVGEQTNLWYTDEEVEADVLAYYPYKASANYNAAGYTFTINADQSTEGAYTASDLMVAATTSRPTASAVTLPFRHALSKVVLTINNQLGEAIENVWFSGVYGTTTINLLDGGNQTSGSTGTIKAAKVNDTTWALIVVPQENIKPQLIVTTASKKQYTFDLAEAVTFSSGKVSSATVELTKESLSTSFTPTITDWVADNELQFNQTGEGEEGDIDVPFVAEESGLGVVGKFAASAWATDAILYTTPTQGLLVAEDVVMVAGDDFKIRTAGTWEGDVNIGRNANAVNYIKANHYIAVENDGNSANIAVEADGTYDIYFNQNTMVVYIMADGEDYTTAVEQTENGEEPVTEEPELTDGMLYLAPNANWKADGARFAAYFFEAGEAWVSMTDSDADGIYEVGIPVGGYTKVIFCRMNPATTANNWNNKWNQTADLVIPTDGTNLYTVAEGAWDSGEGAWSTK
ncbi:MAG: fimbrillin family protein [Tidjanibacter sp.]|nr:fimbrillin family protein [Tidjanibacter sp.]